MNENTMHGCHILLRGFLPGDIKNFKALHEFFPIWSIFLILLNVHMASVYVFDGILERHVQISQT